MKKSKVLKVGIVYNAFDPSEMVKDEIRYKKGATLDHYLEGLPADCEWKIGLNGIPIESESDFEEIVPKPDDVLTLVVVPQGGSAKDILRMVALIAIVVAAVYFLGPASAFAVANGALASAAAMTVAIVAGSVLVNTLLPPAGLKSQKDDGQSYGYDGAKNTAKEGVSIPVIYGEYHVAGNYIDLQTRNIGDDQYMYGRVILSDGEIDGLVGSPILNDQPIENYSRIDFGFTPGSLTNPPVPLFNRSVSQQQRQVKLSTDWSEFTTTTDVDQLQLNFGFPEGICHVQKDGDKKSLSVSVEVQYREGSGAWTSLGFNGYKSFSGPSPEGQYFQALVRGTPQVSDKLSEDITYNIEYRKVGDTSWTVFKTINENVTSVERLQTFQQSDSFILGQLEDLAYKKIPQEHIINIFLTLGSYEFRVTGQGQLIDTAFKTTEMQAAAASTILTYTDSRTKSLRKTYETPTLTRGTYQCRVRRTNFQSTADRDFDEVWLTDVGEIQHSKVGVRSVATGWFSAKMTDQLSGIPNIIWPIKGVKVVKYNSSGLPVAYEWSDNPAWIVLDMLISDLRGSLKGKIKIDFPAFVDWADYCETNGFKFNGVFDTAQSLWDALANVFRIGRATPTRIGSRLSVAIDRPAQPVMLFGPGNIEKDTFNISYMALADRANEFEVSYFDKADSNKQKSIRIVDPQAEIDGQIPKPASYTLIGVDNFEQAKKEVWYQLYMNRLAKRVISFDAPIESIGLGIGDVALIQHDMVNWGTSGRLDYGSTSTVIKLDRDVTIELGQSYKFLMTFDKIEKITGDISHLTGSIFLLENLVGDWSDKDKLKRLVTNTGKEAAVSNFEMQSATSATVILDKQVTGTTFTVYDVDAIEERDVTTLASTTNTITVSPALPAAPPQYANYMFGIVDVVKKPFRLRAIAGDDLHSRSLTFVEYNEYIYSAPEFDIPEPTIREPKLVNHINNLNYVSDNKLYGGSRKVRGILSWNVGRNNHYGGADVYVAIGSEDFAYHSSVLNSTEAQFEFNVGLVVKFKVIAFDTTLRRANSATAPILSQTIVGNAEELVAPSGMLWSLKQVDFTASGTVSWTKAVADTLNGQSAGNHTRIQIKHSSEAQWTDFGVTTEASMALVGILGGNSIIRIRTENINSISEWVELPIVIPTPVLLSPVLDVSGMAIDHVENNDGSSDISFEWDWFGDQSTIDGFEIIHRASTSAETYILNTSPSNETINITSADKRAIILRGVPTQSYYTFYVRAFKKVHVSFNSKGLIYSTAVKSTVSEENPYRPSSNISFNGDIQGTINGKSLEEFEDLLLTGRAQTLKDETFSPSWWNLSTATRVPSTLSRTGWAIEIPFLPNVNYRVTNSTGQRGLSTFTRVDPGETVYLRLKAVSLQPSEIIDDDGAFILDDDLTPLTDDNTLSVTDFDLEAGVEWLNINGEMIGKTVAGTLTPDGLVKTINGRLEAPANTAYARYYIGYPSQTGKTGKWLAFEPWLAEYQPTADNTADVVPTLTLTPPIKLDANYNGVVTTPLPMSVANKRSRGGFDVSATTEWGAIFPPGVTGTINNIVDDPHRGWISITAATASGIIKISTVRDDVTLSGEVSVEVIPTTAPEPGSGTTSTMVVNTSVSTTTFVTVGTPITFTPSDTSATLGGSISFEVDADDARLSAKWQISTDASVWTDVGAEIIATTRAVADAESGFRNKGSLSLNQTATGLTADTSYFLRLRLRIYDGFATSAYAKGNGSVTA